MDPAPTGGNVVRPVRGRRRQPYPGWTTLSGGNQQKVLLARWAARDPELFIFNEPTRGIDVKTREAIHRWIESLAESGRWVLLVSSDTQELAGWPTAAWSSARGGSARTRAARPRQHTLIAAMMEGEYI